jgi:hypothetical protein
MELGKCHWPLQAALSGSLIKAPGFAGGYLLPHDVNPGGEYLPKFATDLLMGKRLTPKTDSDGNPLPRRLEQMAIKRRNTPFGTTAILAEFQAATVE